jgi:hydrogenase expression/formation protein HypD
MEYVDEYRDPRHADAYVRAIRESVRHPWTIMEVCGGQTHTIVRYGIDQVLAPDVTLLHGPGCPVCVTSSEFLHAAFAIAARPEVIFCSFGDMLRVPAGASDLLQVKAGGGDVRIVYSPMDTLAIAANNPGKQVVFFAVGFETTAPATACAVLQARQRQLANLSFLVAHVLVSPAIESILSSPLNRIRGLLAAGHVCTVTGCKAYESIAEAYRIPIVVTGFEPLDLLQGILMCVRQLEAGRYEVENQYARSVRFDGNPNAQRLIEEVFEVTSRSWRGLGSLPRSGLRLREAFASLDAERRFGVDALCHDAPGQCMSGEVLRGHIRPRDCPAFGTSCTPDNPLGAPMVSSEGACAAYYRYRNQSVPVRVGDA